MAGKKWISNIAFPPVVSYSWSCGFDDRFIHVRSIHSFTRNLIEPQLLPEREIQNTWSIFFFPFHSTIICLTILFFHLTNHIVSFSWCVSSNKMIDSYYIFFKMSNTRWSLGGPVLIRYGKFYALWGMELPNDTHIFTFTHRMSALHTHATRATHTLLNAFWIYATHTHRTIWMLFY